MGWRCISVKGRDGLEIRAHSGYFYNPSRADLQKTRQHDLDQAVYSPFDLTALPITARWKQTVAGEKPGEMRAEFELILPANFTEIDDADNNRIELDIVALARASDGKGIGVPVSRTIEGHLNASQVKQLREKGLTYANALELPSGEYTVRFVVRDGLNGRIGSVAAPLKVSIPAAGASAN
ncbi:MAG TPA: hypothetical protein VK466_16490 [Terriglobales bacterium]|nr:hypothetical protein [Terriglobales bacterium]